MLDLLVGYPQSQQSPPSQPGKFDLEEYLKFSECLRLKMTKGMQQTSGLSNRSWRTNLQAKLRTTSGAETGEATGP